MVETTLNPKTEELMRSKNTQPWLLYVDPQTIEVTADRATPYQVGTASSISWPEMIQDIELGDKELDVLIDLGVSILDIQLLYAYYWKEHTLQEIAELCGCSDDTILNRMNQAKESLLPILRNKISRVA